MTLSFRTGQLSSGTVTGNQVITGVGFQPKAVIMYTAGYFVGFDTIDSFFEWGFGAAADTTAANQKSTFLVSDDNAAISNTHQSWNGSAVTIPGTGDSQDCTATLTALGSDGFTLNWSLLTTNSRMEYMCFGGADITNTKVGEFTGPTVTGNQSVTGLGFMPDVLILFGSGNTAAGTATGCNRGLGFAISSTSQVCNAGISVHGQDNMVCKHYQRSGNTACYALIDNTITATVVGLEGSLVSMNSDGFTINWTTVSAGQASVKIGYLAMKGGRWKIGAVSSPTAGTAPVSQATTGVGFQPRGLVMANVGSATATTVGANNQAGFGGGSSVTDRRCTYAADNDAATAAVTMNVNKTTKIASMYTAATTHGSSTLNAEADLTSLDADGFTLSWTTKSASVAYESIYLAAGDAAIVVGVRNFQVAKAYFTSDN